MEQNVTNAMLKHVLALLLLTANLAKQVDAFPYRFFQMDCHFNARQVDYIPLSHSSLQLSLSVHNAPNALRVEPVVRVQEIMQSLRIQ